MRRIVSLMCLLWVIGLWSPIAHAVISIGSPSQAPDAFSGAGGVSWTHNVTLTSNVALYVCVTARGLTESNLHVQSLTLTPAGNTPSLVRGNSQLSVNGGAIFRAELWEIKNPPAGNVTVQVTLAGATDNWIMAQAIDMGNV